MLNATLCVAMQHSTTRCCECASSSGSSRPLTRPLKTCLSQPQNIKLTIKTVGLNLSGLKSTC